jgi:hypothetical protein
VIVQLLYDYYERYNDNERYPSSLYVMFIIQVYHHSTSNFPKKKKVFRLLYQPIMAKMCY